MKRVATDGKHLTVDGSPFRIKGVTYGSFVPRLDGTLFPDPTEMKKDFVAIEAAGFNTIRTYTAPPPDLLDLAAELDLRVMVGLHFEDWRYETETGRRAQRRVLDAGLRAVEEAVAVCAGRPEVLSISVGNEVPADVIRTNKVRHVEKTLSRLIEAVHEGAPGVLATYNNFPTTAYLEIEGQDLICFNVFLENPEAFRRYLRHLQIRSGDAPLVLTELGLASEIHGEDTQADVLEWQLRIADETGVAGATVFAWTDDWAVDGKPVDGWGFGLTRTDRSHKPALTVASRWTRSSVKDVRSEWPALTAVVCAYNAEAYIEECLESLAAVDYPNFEVLVCDDGSSDRTVELARRFPARILELPRGGLSRARNAGIEAASGEIVAFIDSDAYCHPEWPYFIALSLEDEGVLATGGPNLPVEGVGLAERVVAHSPGGPMHVLVTDDRAEHVPGCNMAYKKRVFSEIGGFDPIYTAAGDDVDVCWKVLEADHQIAFSPAAQVRHHRRDSIKGYLKQQKGYGKAERLVAARHRGRFNRLGQARWAGFIYGSPQILPGLLRPVVYHGYQGIAPYQGIVHRRSEHVLGWATALLPLLIPFIFIDLMLALTTSWWPIVSIVAITGILAFATAVAVAVRPGPDEPRPLAYRTLIGAMHVLQPLVRTWGRLRARKRDEAPTSCKPWSGDRFEWLSTLSAALIARRSAVRIGSPTDDWDLEVVVGPFVADRISTAVLWSWTPVVRTRRRLRTATWTLLGLSVVLGTQNVAAGAALFGALLGVALVEMILVRRTVDAAVAETTPEADG